MDLLKARPVVKVEVISLNHGWDYNYSGLKYV